MAWSLYRMSFGKTSRGMVKKRHRKLFDIAKKCEGLKRHFGIHAAGVVVSRRKLIKYCPLQIRSLADPIVMTQWEMNDLC